MLWYFAKPLPIPLRDIFKSPLILLSITMIYSVCSWGPYSMRQGLCIIPEFSLLKRVSQRNQAVWTKSGKGSMSVWELELKEKPKTSKAKAQILKSYSASWNFAHHPFMQFFKELRNDLSLNWKSHLTKDFVHPSFPTTLTSTSYGLWTNKRQILNAAMWKQKQLHKILLQLIALKLKPWLV